MKDSTRMVLDQRGKARSLHEWLNAIEEKCPVKRFINPFGVNALRSS